MNISPLFRLQAFDYIKALVMVLLTTAISAIFIALSPVFLGNGFDLFTANWGAIFHTSVNVGFTAAFAYLVKNFFSGPSAGVSANQSVPSQS